ncbi:MAG: hypothetical protein M3296_03710 [Actinomycetota bacterium]|nr:hypothetical protein [Actinomycetota bacterium]
MLSERGEISLTQLLVAMALFIVILSATLTSFTAFNQQERQVEARNDAQDVARNTMDRLARQLRNLANPTSAAPQAIDRATATDLVFQNVDAVGPNTGANTANARRVRYCLDTTTDPQDAKMWMQVQTWTNATPPASPASVGCPDGAWGNRTEVVRHVTNYASSQSRAVFTYNAASPVDISSVHLDLYVDADPRRPPVETKLSSGVFLRNQNRRPAASFTASPTTSGIVLNGAASSDPDGQVLAYYWYDGTAPGGGCPPPSTQGSVTETGYVGSGITYTYPYPAGHSATYNLWLKVCDSAGLSAVAGPTKVVR